MPDEVYHRLRFVVLLIAFLVLPAVAFGMGRSPETNDVEGQDPFKNISVGSPVSRASEAQEEALEKSRPPMGREIEVSEKLLREENRG